MKVIIDIEFTNHTDLVLTNSNGDTFTSINEDLQDFFSGLKEFKFDVTQSSSQLKEKKTPTFEEWINSEGYIDKWDGYFKKGIKFTYWKVKGRYLQAMKV